MQVEKSVKEEKLREFFQQGRILQERFCLRYGLPSVEDMTNEQRHAYVSEFLSHLMEEAVEARVLVPRRFWKDEKSYLEEENTKREFCYELCDILLFLRAIVYFCGIPLDEVLGYWDEKINYNYNRKDRK